MEQKGSKIFPLPSPAVSALHHSTSFAIIESLFFLSRHFLWVASRVPTHDPPASTSQALSFQACTATPSQDYSFWGTRKLKGYPLGQQGACSLFSGSGFIWRFCLCTWPPASQGPFWVRSPGWEIGWKDKQGEGWLDCCPLLPYLELPSVG